MKTVAHWMRKARSLSREFQSGIDEMVREAELEDARKALESTRHGNLQRTIGNAIDPEGELTSEVKSVEREAGREPGASASEAAPSAEAGKDGKAGRAAATRAAERRVGKACVSTGNCPGWTYDKKKNKRKTQ